MIYKIIIMKINIWFVSLIIVILILWCIAIPSNEHFDQSIYDSQYFYELPPTINGVGPRVHAKIKDGNVIYYSWQSPSCNGEQGCAVVPCPSNLGDNVTCWCCCNYF
jgi:hypothetical protein